MKNLYLFIRVYYNDCEIIHNIVGGIQYDYSSKRTETRNRSF